ATDVRSGEPDGLPDEVHEEFTRLHLRLALLPVHGHGDMRHEPPPFAKVCEEAESRPAVENARIRRSGDHRAKIRQAAGPTLEFGRSIATEEDRELPDAGVWIGRPICGDRRTLSRAHGFV